MHAVQHDILPYTRSFNPYLQPLDRVVNKVVKDQLRDEYAQILLDQDEEDISIDVLRNRVITWVDKIWNGPESRITPGLIINSFKACGIQNSLDESEDDLLAVVPEDPEEKKEDEGEVKEREESENEALEDNEKIKESEGEEKEDEKGESDEKEKESEGEISSGAVSGSEGSSKSKESDFDPCTENEVASSQDSSMSSYDSLEGSEEEEKSSIHEEEEEKVLHGSKVFQSEFAEESEGSTPMEVGIPKTEEVSHSESMEIEQVFTYLFEEVLQGLCIL
eukprot:TRINITY_DN8150_c0_g1_i5.p2 TRINITY_DN8150_c0_g1~~TRINITY_DN8150_c0_g1_i5.p2  ORF type:complete len:278 (-),score=43.39 TRINITY_DN8150_c0_g1_i5:125-958(-)